MDVFALTLTHITIREPTLVYLHAQIHSHTRIYTRTRTDIGDIK